MNMVLSSIGAELDWRRFRNLGRIAGRIKHRIGPVIPLGLFPL